MGRTSFRSRKLAPLLLLLIMCGRAAAPPSPELVYREAQAAWDRGETKEVASMTTNALQQFGDSDDAWVWRIRVLCADALISGASYEEARKILQRPLPAKLDGSEIEVLRLRGLALAAYRLAEYQKGEQLIQQAYALAKKYPRLLPSVLLVLAIYDKANSEVWAREGIAFAHKYGDVLNELNIRGTLANQLAEQERFDEAIAMWVSGLQGARRLGNARLIQKFEGNLGWGYMELGDYETAGDFFTRAAATATRIGARRDAVPWTYQLGNVRFQNGDFDGAGRLYLAALHLAVKTKHDQKPIVLALLANVALKTGRLADAQRYADASLAERKKAKDEKEVNRSLLLNGRVAMAAGQFGEAERLLKHVLARSSSPQVIWEAHGRLAQLYARIGKAPEAEIEFRQSLTTAQTARNNVRMELRFAFFTTLADLFDSYVDFLIAGGRVPDALAVTETIRAQNLEEGLTGIAPLRDVRTIARDTGTTLLCYWLGGEHSYLWIVTPNRIDAVTLPPKRIIEARIDEYQRDLLAIRGTLAISGDRGEALWRMLVGPAARVLAPGSRVIIVPSGGLHAFNMETLVVPGANPHYWIEDAVIATAGSLKLLVRNAQKQDAATLLLVGNAPAPSPEFGALPQAGAEMEKVRLHFKATQSLILSGPAATASRYRAASPGTFAYLHFVAHGVAMRQNPLDSAVVLAREGDEFKLYARDIARQTLTARLVTISSCQGAGTRAYAGEGLVGLAWAFLRAGAGNVIAALWDVNDSTTPALMDKMYEGIRAGRDPAVALRDAKLTLLHGEGVARRPMYWAPFVLYSGT